VLTRFYSGDIKSGRMRWAGHVARMRERGKNIWNLGGGNLRGKGTRIILNRTQREGAWIGMMWLRLGTSSGFL